LAGGVGPDVSGEAGSIPNSGMQAIPFAFNFKKEA